MQNNSRPTQLSDDKRKECQFTLDELYKKRKRFFTKVFSPLGLTFLGGLLHEERLFCKENSGTEEVLTGLGAELVHKCQELNINPARTLAMLTDLIAFIASVHMEKAFEEFVEEFDVNFKKHPTIFNLEFIWEHFLNPNHRCNDDMWSSLLE